MRPYAVSSAAFWRAYAITLRPYLLFVSGASGLVGLALAPRLSWGALGAGVAAFFLSYGLGQALTDVSQIDTDSISSPYRPLTQGVITGRQVLLVSLAGLLLCAVVFVVLSPWTLALSALGVAGLATYTPLKRRWWGGPFWNSWIVALLPAIGFVCGASPREALGSGPLAAAMASVFFTYATFVLLGYLKDISADRQTGYDTMPVRFGWVASVALSLACATLGLAASAWLLGALPFSWRTPQGAGVGVLWGTGAVLLVGGHLAMLRTRDETRAHGPIGIGLRGYVALHLAEAAAARVELVVPSLAYYALFEWALAARPERTQV